MVLAIAAKDTSGVLERVEIERRAPGEQDVDIEIKYCGICHSDLHSIRAEWPIPSMYPMVPGHEIAGIVRAVGSQVTKFKVGDRVGVGCIVDSCRECGNCSKGLEQFCAKGNTGTYNSKATYYGKSGPKTKVLEGHSAEYTFGGYSQSIVVTEECVVRIPDSIDLAASAPLLCAGITTYSPLAFFGAKDKGSACTTGVIGFGGLGHMAVKLALSMGNTVYVFSTSVVKKAAVEELGAKFVCSADKDQMAAVTGKCNFILDTVSGNHDANLYLSALAVDGTFCVVGAPQAPFSIHAFSLIMARKSVAGSLIGGIPETQEMLDYCAAKGIVPDVQLISPKDANHAM
eukprot:CAMPEP_0113704838 /NCGR_PEP_ID=MMETSP0038_2-20120614/26762_1 /TAXON_ID=2898 /ORGANISM="Cryptomonas paramecium" /LENGTH=343 /DNA_ID=CAMNT_0000629705 /DNA_START=27 /DNA_END=1055 /DNA_ORIENTATION=- /assembly_acc=CAM_ASM_000170